MFGPDFEIHVINDFASPEMHKRMWGAVKPDTPRWYFGRLSWLAGAVEVPESCPFWRMDLDGDETADAFWEHVRPRCEELVGKPLESFRQYANGHTYGLGGEPHRDDSRENTYTLLYYPMLVWNPDWDGETVFYKGGPGDDKPQAVDWDGFERVGSVRPLPNRAILFDSRATHVARAPSRYCPWLRVTIAWKLQEPGSGRPHQ